jgi:hypothetical protein
VDGAGRPDTVQRVWSFRSARPVDAKFHSMKGQRLYFMWGLINSPLAGLGWCCAPLALSVHALGVLGEPLTHLCLQECESIASECDSSALHHEIASSGTRCSSYKLVVLVTLGGCHLLNSLVACDSVETRKKIVRGSGEAL